MLVIPAMDILNGRIVMGAREGRTEHPTTPAEMGEKCNELGVETIQIFDLDAHYASERGDASGLAKADNHETVQLVKGRAPQTAIQLGSGIRTMEALEQCAEIADKLIIGGFPVRERDGFLCDVENIIGRDRVVFAVDFHGYDRLFGKVSDYCKRFSEHARYVLLTARQREGLMIGPDLELYERVCQHMEGTETDMIAAGGMKCCDDIRRLRDTGVYGAVIGKALYKKDGIRLEDAMKV